MSALSDAVDAVRANQTKIETDVKAVLALLKQPNPDVDAAVSALTAIVGEQTATESELEGAVAPPAPPTP